MAIVYFNESLYSMDKGPCLWYSKVENNSHIRALAISRDIINLPEDFSIIQNKPMHVKLVLDRVKFSNANVTIVIVTKDDGGDGILFMDTEDDGFKVRKSIKSDKDYIGVFFSNKGFVCLNKEKTLVETGNKSLPLEDIEDINIMDPNGSGKIGIYELGAIIAVGFKEKAVRYELTTRGWEKRYK